MTSADLVLLIITGAAREREQLASGAPYLTVAPVRPPSAVKPERKG